MNQMTCSSSMSSLESAQKYLRTPEGSKNHWYKNRQCNSLNSKKPRRAFENKMCRSWDYQDDTNPKELCKPCLKPVQGLLVANPDEQGLKEFLETYSNMCEWLNSLQARRGRFLDSRILDQLADELTHKQSWRTEVNDRAKELMQCFPKLKEEFRWRIKHLNSQWDSLEEVFLCQKTSRNTMDSVVPTNNGKEDCNTAWLREWLQKMEDELQPLDFRIKWTAQNLEAEMKRHKALQTEIEEKSAEVHAALRGQSQSQGRGGDVVNVKRAARLEKRWHQLRLRVLEWVELLSGIQQRARHQRHEKRSEKCTQKWESDEDNNEPLNKYRRLGGGSQQQLPGADDDTSSLSLNEGQESTFLLTTVITTTTATSTSADSGNKENFCGLDSSTTESHSESVHVVVDGSDDWTMGQSHETESVFSQSGSPVPNSVVEFTFVDGSQSVGMKRKLSPSPSQQMQQQQHVVPKNISTYYFKHSDTEPEVNQYHRVESGSDNIIMSNDDDDKGKDLMRNGSSQEQKLRKTLDLSQECAQSGRTTILSVDELNFTSLELDVDMEAEEESHSFENVDEIEELVQNAEWLVKVRSKGVVVESVNVVNDLLISDEEEEEECNVELLCASAGADKIIASSATLTPCVVGGSVVGCAGAAVTHIQHQLRKSSIGSSGGTSGGGKRPKSTKCTITNVNNSMEQSLMSASHDTAGVAILDGECGFLNKAITIGINKTTTTLADPASTTKKNARVRRWIRAHNKTDIQKNTSSCDASAESTSETETSSSDSELPLSSDDPTTVSASTFLNQTQALLNDSQGVLSQSLSHLKGAASSCSSSAVGVGNGKQRSPPASMSGGVTWRSKKRHGYAKQRPKSFTEALSNGSGTLLECSTQNNCCFVSDTALNFLGNQSQSGSWSSSAGSAYLPGQGVTAERDKKKIRYRKKSSRTKRKSVEVDENDIGATGFVRSTSFSESRLEERVVPDTIVLPAIGPEDKLDGKGLGSQRYQSLDKGGHSKCLRLNSDNGSVNTEELHGLNDQDWDSYQEKYLSEPYSEEPYDPDGTSKLLAFGEDYGQYLDRADSECSSVLSGFEPNLRKRRPLVLLNRGEMPESDSDREELNYLLSQSTSQLRFVDVVFRKQLVASSDLSSNAPAEYAEMEATCEENINSLQLILASVEKPDGLPFDIDVRSFQGLLERWHILKEKITHAAKLQQIQEEMVSLKKDFDTVQSHLGLVDPFDASDLTSLQNKIELIQGMLSSLNDRKHKLQSLNEASLGTQLFLKESNAVTDIKQQIQELYALYEENFQLGSYLLGKMRFLQDAWEKFESEKAEFEKSINFSNMRPKLKKELSSATSSDSGHGTDFSHDSSISDSDMDFQERRQKLVALRKRASDLKAFLPPGSPVMDVINQKIDEAQKGFEELRRKEDSAPLDLKIIYPKKRTQPLTRKSGFRKTTRSVSTSASGEFLPDLNSNSTSKKTSRRWRIIRLTLTFHLALMGLLAAAYFLQPKCCEFSNTFRCSLVPHLTHESLPTI